MWPSRVPGERVGDQNIHQFGLRDPRRLPKLWIHADGGKARQRVHLVHEDVFALEEKVDTGESSAAEDLKCLDGKLPDALRAVRRNICGNDEPGSLCIGIFCFIRVKAMAVCRAGRQPWLLLV